MSKNHLRVASGHKIDSLQTVRFQRTLDEEILPRLERPGRCVGPFEARGIDPRPADPSPFVLLWPSLPEGGELPVPLLEVCRAIGKRWSLAAEIACAPAADLELELARAGLPHFSRPGWHPLGAFRAWLVWMRDPTQLLGLLTLLRAAGLPGRAADRDGTAPLVLAAGPGAKLGAEILRPFCDLVALHEEPDPVLDLLDSVLTAGDVPAADLTRAGVEAGTLLTSCVLPTPVELGDVPGSAAGGDGWTAVDSARGTEESGVAPVSAWDLRRPPVETSINASGTPVTILRPWAASQSLRERRGLASGPWLAERVEETFDQATSELIVHLAVGLPEETAGDRAAIATLVRDLAEHANHGPKQILVFVSPYVLSSDELAVGARPAPPGAARAWLEQLLLTLRATRVRCFAGDPASAWVGSLLAAAPPAAAPVVERIHAAGGRVGESTLARSADLWQKALRAEGFDALGPPAATAGASMPAREALARVLEPEKGDGEWAPNGTPPGATGLWRSSRGEGSRLAPQVRGRGGGAPPTASGAAGGSAGRDRWKRWQALAPRQFEYRIEFTKQGRIRYVGHREMSALFVRACHEAGLALATSGLAQPRPKIVFGPPLPVGVEGLREYVDISLTRKTSDLQTSLSRRLPEGIVVRDVCFIPAASARSSLGQLARAEYECTVATGNWIDGATGPEQWAARIASSPGEASAPGGADAAAAELRRQVTGIRVLTRDDAHVRFAFGLDLTASGVKCKPRDVLLFLLGDLVKDLRLLPLVRTCLLTRSSAGSRPLLTPMEQVRTMIRDLRARERQCA